MTPEVDPAMLSLFGSRTRLLTLTVLANAKMPLTGYRVAVMAGVPREKVYPELRKAVSTGIVERSSEGYTMVDADLARLLCSRMRIRWSVDWDREREGWEEGTIPRLNQILREMPTDPEFLRPRNWKPTVTARAVIAELRRPSGKDRILREQGLRTSGSAW